jgi:hypothetical protein
MHVPYNHQPYSSTTNAMKAWRETATATAVQVGILGGGGKVEREHLL